MEQKKKEKQKLIQFENLLCKEKSKETDRLLKSMIMQDPQLIEQYMYLLTLKERLSLHTFAIINQPPTNQQSMKLMVHLCHHLSHLEQQQLVPVWKALYLQYDTNLNNRYVTFYEALSSFCFGGANRKAITNSLAIIRQLLRAMKDRQDNALLSDIVADYSRNFLKFNILQVEYILTMNTVMSLEGIPLPIDLISLTNRYLHFLRETRKKLGQHQIQAHILEGLDYCGSRVLQSAYILGSMHEQVLEQIGQLLTNSVFVVRNTARNAIATWNRVQIRVKKQQSDKQVKADDDNRNIDDMIEERVQQNQNQLKLLKFMEASEKYAVKREIARKRAVNELATEYDRIHSKDYLKKKTGTGGGYVTVSSVPATTSGSFNHIYQQIFRKMDRQSAPSNIIEQDDDFTSSHLSTKYDLEKTIEYSDEVDPNYVDRLLSNNLSQKGTNPTVTQIERLIDMAYQNYRK